MASDLVINKYNVNMVVVDDVHLRFESGDYKTEQEVFGFILVENDKVSACIYEDADVCYKDYYFYNMEQNKYTSVVIAHTFILPQPDESIKTANRHEFEAWLLQQNAVIMLLKQIAKEVEKQSLVLPQNVYTDIVQDDSVIDLLLERKINLGPEFDHGSYLQNRKIAYDTDIYCTVYGVNENSTVFLDKRTANIVKQRDFLYAKGVASSGLVYFHQTVDKAVYYLKQENIDKISEVKKLWNNVMTTLHGMDDRTVSVEKTQDDNIFHVDTYRKYAVLFHL